MKLICKMNKVGVPNRNGHIYSKECLKSIVEKCKKRPVIPVFGSVEDAVKGDCKKAVGIAELSFKKGRLIGEVITLSTPRGKSIETLIKKCSKESISFGMTPVIDGVLDSNNHVDKETAKLLSLAVTPIETLPKYYKNSVKVIKK